jgi:hypothetical protein
MDRTNWALVLALIDLGCWAVCFVWMRKISKRQSDVLTAIHSVSKAEHALIKEVHPQVGEIKESVEEVKAAVKNDTARG